MRKRVTRAVPQDHQAPWMTTMNQKALRTRVLNDMLFRSSQNYGWSGLASRLACSDGWRWWLERTPRMLPPVMATIPERNDPRALARTENQTATAVSKLIQLREG